MLYAILKPIVTLALRLYFRRISRSRLELIDNGRPTLILANHTASFMDAILVACFVRRRIHFFARGDVFGNKWADKVLRSIGLLPVYRLSEGRDKLHLNDDSNDEALNILAKGGAVLIFCEGTSDIAKRLKPLKKGPFRLAATAAATLPEPPVIIPLGINYITPTKAGGDVFLLADSAISIKDFVPENTEPCRAKGATDMMRRTDQALGSLVWHTRDPSNEPMADELLLALQNSRRIYSFQDTQQVLATLNTVSISGNEAMAAGGAFWEGQLVSNEKKFSLIASLLALILLFPIAVVGWLVHMPAIALARKATHDKVDSPDFIAPVFLSLAIFLVLLSYIVLLVVGLLFWPGWLVAIGMLVTAVSGIVYLKVYRVLLGRAGARGSI